MNNVANNIGNNIRTLRLLNNETQEQLAAAIYIDAGALSHYENGRRNVSIDIIVKIAEHYSVPPNYIYKSDFPNISDIVVDSSKRLKDPYYLFRNLDYLIPIVNVKEEDNESGFNEIVLFEKKAFELLGDGDLDRFDDLGECFDKYQEFYKEDKNKLYAAINMVGLWLLFYGSSIGVFKAFAKRKSFLIKLGKLLGKKIPKDAFNKEIKQTEAFEKSVDYEKMFDFYEDALTLIRESQYKDIAYYFKALQYCFGAERDVELPYSTGLYILNSMASMGNIFAYAGLLTLTGQLEED